MQALGNPCRNVRGRCGTHREGLVARCGTRGGAESARGVFRHWFGAGYHILLLPGNPLRHTSAQLPRCRYVAGGAWFGASYHVLLSGEDLVSRCGTRAGAVAGMFRTNRKRRHHCNATQDPSKGVSISVSQCRTRMR